MAEPKKALMSLVKVAKFFGSRLIFKNINLNLLPGQVVLVAGNNGAGKSTLLRLMAGLSSPSAGQIDNLVGEQKTAYMGHGTFVYPGLSAWQNLCFWQDMYGLGFDKERLKEILNIVGLVAFSQEKAGTFSRGMAQRLSLARILLIEPQVLLLDEPATGLDKNSQELLLRIIVDWKNRGAAIAWVSHHLEHDMQYADQVLHLQAGKKYWQGTAQDYRRRQI